MNPLRILIVEDQQVISFANEALLRSKGYNNIVLATNGPEALELTGTFKPNILLMDISLKGKTDGIDAAEQILAQLKIPVIFITGNSHLISDERLLAIRPFDIIIKPVPDWKLLDVVERAALSLPIELPTPQTDDTGHREKREIEFPEELALILVIDDKPGNLYVTSQLIGQYQPQIEIKTTTDPAIGLKMAAEFQPDCILMDFQMPGIDGITMCKRLKTNPDTEHIPVIIITADHVSATGRAKGLEAGADDFLSRPFENIELLAKIKVMLRIKRTEDRLRKLNRNLEKNLREKLDALMESEQRFAAFMDYIPAGVFIKDQHHRIVYLNRYMTDMFDAEDWIGKLAKQRFPEKIAMGMMADDKKIMEQDNLEIEEKIPDKNGILHTYQTHKFAIKQEGKTPLLGGIALDITKRKQAEEALKENKNQLEIRVRARTRELRESEEKFKVISEKSMVGVFIVSGKKYQYVNPAFARNFAYSVDEMMQIEFTKIVAPGDKKAVKGKIAKLMKGEIEYSLSRFTGLQKDGNKRYLEMYMAGIKLENKPAVIGAAIDITQRRQFEEALKEKSEQLENLNKDLENRIETELEKYCQQEQIMVQQSKLAAMGEMVGAIAHQWRQPLTTVGVIMRNIKMAHKLDKLDGNTIDKLIKDAGEQIAYMSKTIDDFRNFFKPSRAKENFDVDTAVDETCSIIRSQMENDAIELEIIRDKSKEHRSTGYPNEFKQVLVNIINNATNAIVEKRENGQMPRDAGKISIEITGEDRPQNKTGDSKLTVKIANTGTKIAKENINRIFEPYFTTRPAGKGMGIGLHMSRTIIEEQMEGRISAENTGDGVLFTIELNLK